MPHKDLREHLEALEKFGKLRRIKKEVDKDWEIAAVCRELFYRFKPEDRPALLFENVKGFNIPVAAGTSAASPDIYRLGMSSFSMKGTIQRKWIRALDHLIAPEIVNKFYGESEKKLRELFESLENETSKQDLESFLKLLSVFSPHLAEELYEKLGNKSFISLAKWPIIDESKIARGKAIGTNVADV